MWLWRCTSDVVNDSRISRQVCKRSKQMKGIFLVLCSLFSLLLYDIHMKSLCIYTFGALLDRFLYILVQTIFVDTLGYAHILLVFCMNRVTLFDIPSVRIKHIQLYHVCDFVIGMAIHLSCTFEYTGWKGHICQLHCKVHSVYVVTWIHIVNMLKLIDYVNILTCLIHGVTSCHLKPNHLSLVNKKYWWICVPYCRSYNELGKNYLILYVRFLKALFSLIWQTWFTWD